MRALLLIFTLIVQPGALRCVPARLLSRQHSFGSGSGFTRRSTGEPELHTGSDGPVKKIEVQLDFLVILPLRTRTSNFVSIFDLRLKQFLCMDLTGEMYHSRKQNSEDCVFQRIWLDLKKNHHVFFSSSSGLLLRLQAAEGHRPTGQESPEGYRPMGQESPEGYRPMGQEFPSDDTLLARLLLLRPLARRQRRTAVNNNHNNNNPVNPSDPLRSEPPPPPPAAGGAGAGGGGGLRTPPDEQEQPGAVSKETISSCDDPLRVLQQPHPPVSPVKTNHLKNLADEVRSR